MLYVRILFFFSRRSQVFIVSFMFIDLVSLKTKAKTKTKSFAGQEGKETGEITLLNV